MANIRIIVDPEKGLYQTSVDESDTSPTIQLTSGSAIGYTPSDPSKWSSIPGDLNQAVDYLAAGSGSSGGGGGGGGSSFFIEIALDQIATTGSVAMTFLSASTGAVITGSFAQGAEGSLIASGQYSHAEGAGTTASGPASHAEGGLTTASGGGSHAEGVFTQAVGNVSHAEGVGTIAYGTGSHAQGFSTVAYGMASFAAGLGTIASGAVDTADYLPPTTTQAAFGKYNLDNNAESLFVVGDGLDSDNRHDILRVNSGSVQVTGSFDASNGSFGFSDGKLTFDSSCGLIFYPSSANDTNVSAVANQNTIDMVGLTSPRIVTLPSPTTGAFYRIENSDGSASSGSFISVTSSYGATINGKTYSHPAIIQPYGYTQYWYSNGNWSVESTKTKQLEDSWINFLNQNGVANSNEYGGDVNIGIQFSCIKGSLLYGFRIKVSPSTPRDFDVKVWTGGSAVTSSLVAITGSVDSTIIYNDPISLTEGTIYFLTYRDTSGANFYAFNAGLNLKNAYSPNAATRLNPIILHTNYCYYFPGDGQPNTYLFDPQVTFACIEPIIYS